KQMRTPATPAIAMTAGLALILQLYTTTHLRPPLPGLSSKGGEGDLSDSRIYLGRAHEIFPRETRFHTRAPQRPSTNLPISLPSGTYFSGSRMISKLCSKVLWFRS